MNIIEYLMLKKFGPKCNHISMTDCGDTCGTYGTNMVTFTVTIDEMNKISSGSLSGADTEHPQWMSLEELGNTVQYGWPMGTSGGSCTWYAGSCNWDFYAGPHRDPSQVECCCDGHQYGECYGSFC